MSYLGEYRNETRRQGIKDKMLTNLKLIPDWNKQLKNIKFLCHVCRLVATKCKGNDPQTQKDIVISIYTDLFEPVHRFLYILWLQGDIRDREI